MGGGGLEPLLLELLEQLRYRAIGVSGGLGHGWPAPGGRKALGINRRNFTAARRARVLAVFSFRPRIAPIWAKFRPSKYRRARISRSIGSSFSSAMRTIWRRSARERAVLGPVWESTRCSARGAAEPAGHAISRS